MIKKALIIGGTFVAGLLLGSMFVKKSNVMLDILPYDITIYDVTDLNGNPLSDVNVEVYNGDKQIADNLLIQFTYDGNPFYISDVILKKDFLGSFLVVAKKTGFQDYIDKQTVTIDYTAQQKAGMSYSIALKP